MGKRAPAHKEGRPVPRPRPTGTRAAKALSTVVRALERGRRQEAVRLFLQGLSHGIAPAAKPLLKWLTGTIGEKAAARLVDAFVHFPCVYCRKGRTRCEDCDGAGDLDGTPCRRCVGVGIAPCEFCDGTGWVTLDYVPEELRPLVIKNRAALALRRMRDLLRRPSPRPSSKGPDGEVERCSRLLLKLDRQMGVFENVFVAVDHLPDSHEAKMRLRGLVDKCIRAASKGEACIRDTIMCLAEAFRAKAETTRKGSRKQERAERFARFYRSLVDAERTLAGTGLEHPFLHKAVNEAVRDSESKAKPVRPRGRRT